MLDHQSRLPKLKVWIYEHLNIWTSKYLNIWISEHIKGRSEFCVWPVRTTLSVRGEDNLIALENYKDQTLPQATTITKVMIARGTKSEFPWKFRLQGLQWRAFTLIHKKLLNCFHWRCPTYNYHNHHHHNNNNNKHNSNYNWNRVCSWRLDNCTTPRTTQQPWGHICKVYLIFLVNIKAQSFLWLTNDHDYHIHVSDNQDICWVWGRIYCWWRILAWAEAVGRTHKGRCHKCFPMQSDSNFHRWY